jgi:hypothetical protein
MRLRRDSKTPHENSVSRAERRRRRLWIAADIAAVTVIGGGSWWHWLNAVPTVHIPAPPPLPSPNAFDTFVKANDQIVDGDVISGIYSKGSQLPRDRKGIPYSDAEKAAAVAANAEALATLRSGFSQDYQNPSRRGFEALFPELAKFRNLARLLNAEGQVRETKGDFAGAAQSRLDSMQFGSELPRGGNLISALVGIACEKIGMRPLWALVDKLDASGAREAAKRLEMINARRASMADALLEEKWSSEVGLSKEFQRENTFNLAKGLYSSTSDESSSNGPSFGSVILPLMVTSKSQIMANHGAYMDAMAARARMPYQAVLHQPRPILPTDPINAVLLPVFDKASLKEKDMQMQSNLLLTAFALRAYQAEKGDSPENLEALVSGGYLSKIPADPFSESGESPVQYRRLENGKYLLYSIGPDGKDDAGMPIKSAYANGKPKDWVEADTKGDFVVGVNNAQVQTTPDS